MEIFIPDVPKSASEFDVRSATREVLHRPEFSPSAPINFHVRLFKDRKGRPQGKGILALPTRDLGVRFLREYGTYGRRKVVVRNRSLTLRESNKPIDQTIVNHIIRSPYADDTHARKQEQQAALLRDHGELLIVKLQFCWWCRDNRISVEWEHITTSSSRLSFLPEKRQIDVSVVKERTDVGGLSFGRYNLDDMIGDQTFHILFSYLDVQHFSAHVCPDDDAPVLVLFLHNPPSFLSESDGPLSDLFGVGLSQHSALDLIDSTTGRPHSEIAPYCSLCIRLVCSSREGPNTFRRLLRNAGLGLTVHRDPYQTIHANLWSAANLRAYHAWRNELPFFHAYMVESLLSSLALDPRELLMLKEPIRALVREGQTRDRGKDYVAMVLSDFAQAARELFGPELDDQSVLRCFQASKRRLDHPLSSNLLTKRDDDGIFLCLHVIVTPTRILYEGPVPERSNRVIRSYPASCHENFVRVSFTDERKQTIHYSRDFDGALWVRERVGRCLKNGLELAGHSFNFLAFSQSALKNHSVWFLRNFELTSAGTLINVAHIINSLGTFSSELKRCPARYAARISMAFTTTDPTTTDVENLRTIDDIKRVDTQTGTEWNFTDGVGTMSPEFARRVTAGRRSRATLYRDVYPRAIQIRFEGSKGVLSVDHTLSGHTVCLRPSMVKFTGTPSTKIEIAQVFDKPGNFYLNRPLIMILEGLGVPYEVFKKYQDNAIEKVNLATSSLDAAALFLNELGLGTAYRMSGTLIRLHRLGVPLPGDLFYSRAMLYARNDALRDIKHKSRIPIPESYNLVGIADVHGFLNEGEVSVCLELVPGGPRRYISGYVLISRSPCIHPGDVQIAKAIGHPPAGSCFAKEPLANTLVFSTKGRRPLCSYLGGGDLDGDEYVVISLNQHPGFRCIRPKLPGRYDPAVLKRLPRECTQDDIAQFVVDFINTDNLGVLSITWRILADDRAAGILDKDCMVLADLHSRAVDFPKSGTAVAIGEIPRRPSLLPDWHAPETMSYLDPDVYYVSQRAIGRLFREVDLPAIEIVSSAARQERRRAEDEEMVDPFEDEDYMVAEAVSTAFSAFTSLVKQHLPINRSLTPPPNRIDSLRSTFLYYRSQLQSTCSLHSILPGRGAMLTEDEVFIGTIVANSSQPAKRLDHISKVREETTLLVNHVREDLMSGDGETVRDLQRRLRASYWAWRRCVQSDVFGANSFGWIAMDVCFSLIDEIDEMLVRMVQDLQI